MYNIHREAHTALSRRRSVGSAPRPCPDRKDYGFRTGPAGSSGSLPRQRGAAYGGDAELGGNPEGSRGRPRQQRRSQATASRFQARPCGRTVSVLTDSDILIEVSRGRDKALVSRWLELGRSETLILFSPISVAELWAGARPSEYAVLETLFNALTCIPVDVAVGRRAGEYLRRYRKSHAVELGEALIASSAVASGARLWTRNRKHYPMPELAFYE